MDIFHGARLFRFADSDSTSAFNKAIVSLSSPLQRETGLPEGAGQDVQTRRGVGGGVDAGGGRGPAAPAAGGVGAAVDAAGEAAQEAAPVLPATAAAGDPSEGSLAVGVVGVVAGHDSDVAEAEQWQVRNN